MDSAEASTGLCKPVSGHTEFGSKVLDWAKSSGHRRLWATVWDWSTASLRVLAKVGFTESGRVEPDEAHGNTLFMIQRL